MDLIEFISDPVRKQRLAAETGSSPAYLWQLATRWRGKRASTDLAQLIERKTREIGPACVSKESLRPDIWPAHSASEAERVDVADPAHRSPAETVAIPPLSEAA